MCFSGPGEVLIHGVAVGMEPQVSSFLVVMKTGSIQLQRLGVRTKTNSTKGCQNELEKILICFLKFV